MAIRLTLPFPPSTNTLFPGGRGSAQPQGKRTTRRWKSKAYKSWTKQALLSIMVAKIKPATGKVSISIDLYPPDKRKRDASNYIKTIEDILVKAQVIHDDSYKFVGRISAEMKPSDGEAKAIVTLDVMEDE